MTAECEWLDTTKTVFTVNGANATTGLWPVDCSGTSQRPVPTVEREFFFKNAGFEGRGDCGANGRVAPKRSLRPRALGYVPGVS